MAITVFGASYSTRTQRVLFVLEKLGLAYELQNVNMQKGEHRSPGFVASHHPFGKLPAIQDDGIKLFESRAIARYLVAKQPGPLSVPTDLAAIGQFEEAASVEYSYFDPAVSKLGWEKIFKKMVTGQDADASVVAQLEWELRQVLDYHETILAEREWLAGSNFSLIEVFNAPWFNFLAERLGYSKEIESRPHVQAWWERVRQDAAWKKITGT
ncbi:glutathione S-transferase [Lophiostoma macrostomum CBS 122681]|uniref:glutathione transferase n=1 Tax=Lophiostoma macrostomum CBS 122681 TaxID=1314788 RepID=A0A6A6SM92_9PLEO|nr:glutathione S-transferase [Lophiostoma macrostomum CBS 122681]